METNLIKKRISESLNNALNSGVYKNKKELSDKLKTNPTSLNKYLAGETFPQSDWIYYLCKELKIAPNWIIFGDGEEKKLPEEEPKDEMSNQFIEMQKTLLKYKDDEINRLKEEIEALKKSIATSPYYERIVAEPTTQLTKEESKK